MSSRAIATSTATASRTARCRATACPAFFTRGSGHNEKALYSERADDYTNNLDRLARKFDTARTLVPKPEVDMAGERRHRHHRLRHVALGARSRRAIS